MINKNLLSGRDKELFEMAEQYERTLAEGHITYMDSDDWADLADWYATRKEVDKALQVVEHGLSQHPLNTALLVEKAYIYIDEKRRDEAAKIIRLITEDFEPEVKILKANMLLSQGNILEAEKLINSIKEKDDLANIINIGYMYIELGYTAKAFEWLKPNIERYKEDESFMAVLAELYYTDGIMEQAIKLYNKLIDKAPYSAPYWFGLGRCYFDTEEYDKAIEAADYAIVADDEFGEAYLLKGNSFYQLENDELALESYRKAVELHIIGQDFIYSYTAADYMLKQDWRNAYKQFEQALQCTEEHSSPLSSIYANAAFCLSKMKQTEKAIHYFELAHQEDATDAYVYVMEGQLYLENGQTDKAIQAFEQATDINYNPEIWENIGNAYLDFGDLEKASEAYEIMAELNPKYPQIYETLTTLALLQNNERNFQKYNQLCKRPFNEDECLKFQLHLKENDAESMEMLINKIKRIIKK